MLIVDTHCHASDNWYEPVEVLLDQLDRNGVAKAILIQMNGQYNNAYQAACVTKYPDRFASVVMVDVARPDAAQTLARLANEGAAGVRLRADARSPGGDPLAIWRAADKLGLSVSCGGDAASFSSDQFANTVAALPNLKIVVEHLGALNQPVDANQEQLRQKVFGLSRYPNCFIKIHGLGEFARRAAPVKEPFPFEEPVPPLLEQAYAAFGPRRMMWGSDYPPVSGREGYHNALRYTIDQFASRSEDDRAQIFGGTASSVFSVG